MPKLKFWEGGITWAAIGLFLVPVVSAVLSWLQTKISQSTAPQSGDSKANDQSAQTMKTMNLMMPLISLYIGFVMPAALGIYWIYTSLLALIQELILNKVYGKQIAAETAEREERMRVREAEFERKRQETERLRAEGKTQENVNTSKKKQQARQKAEMDELKAAAIREERAARRAAMGIEEEEIPASQVGNRRYARGRAYIPDRFTNPAHAAEAAAAAAVAEEEAAAVAEEEAGACCEEAAAEEVLTAETVAETVEETAAIETVETESVEAAETVATESEDATEAEEELAEASAEDEE